MSGCGKYLEPCGSTCGNRERTHIEGYVDEIYGILARIRGEEHVLRTVGEHLFRTACGHSEGTYDEDRDRIVRSMMRSRNALLAAASDTAELNRRIESEFGECQTSLDEAPLPIPPVARNGHWRDDRGGEIAGGLLVRYERHLLHLRDRLMLMAIRLEDTLEKKGYANE
jgi:hypothetical protein